jgi:hypothetical protein
MKKKQPCSTEPGLYLNNGALNGRHAANALIAVCCMPIFFWAKAFCFSS